MILLKNSTERLLWYHKWKRVKILDNISGEWRHNIWIGTSVVINQYIRYLRSHFRIHILAIKISLTILFLAIFRRYVLEASQHNISSVS